MAFHPSRRKIIDDTTASSDKSYSSNKINNELQGKNLLDNPWFTINQREFSTTTTRVDTYGFDRWRGTYRYDSTNKCSTLSDVEYLIQYLDEDLKKNLNGKTVTASILYADGTIKKGTATYRYPYTDWQTIITDADLYCQIGYSSTSSDLLNGAFTITARNASFSIKAVKLEIGSESTLANDIIPDYAIELAKCKVSSADPSDTFANQGSLFTSGVNAKLGAHNLLPFPYYSGGTQIIANLTIIVDSKGELTTSGTSDGDGNFIFYSGTLKKNTYKFKFKGTFTGGNIVLRVYDSTADVIIGNASGNNEITFQVDATNENHNFALYINWVGAQSITISGRPLFKLASDPSDDDTPYAMTNQELTNNVIYKHFNASDYSGSNSVEKFENFVDNLPSPVGANRSYVAQMYGASDYTGVVQRINNNPSYASAILLSA